MKLYSNFEDLKNLYIKTIEFFVIRFSILVYNNKNNNKWNNTK